MGMSAAKQGDKVVALDTHLIQPPLPAPAVPTPMLFNGVLNSGLSADVKIMGMAAATKDSVAVGLPPHIPIGGTFVKPPANKATILLGSVTVRINGKPAARSGDTAMTCNDPDDLPIGKVVAIGTVNIG